MEASSITCNNYSISGHSNLVLKLYHMTDEAGFAGIHNTQMMKKAARGMLGAGIYFTETPEQACKKARVQGILLEVLVRGGWILVLTKEVNPDLSKELLERIGCDSVKSIEYRTGPEYVVYDSDQVIAAWVMNGIPNVPQVIFPRLDWDDRPVCGMDRACSHNNLQHFIEYKHLHPPIFPVEYPSHEEKPLCPMGERCRDKSIDHFKMYSHPARVTLPMLPREVIQKPYRASPKYPLSSPQYFMATPPQYPQYFMTTPPQYPQYYMGAPSPVFWPPQ